MHENMRKHHKTNTGFKSQSHHAVKNCWHILWQNSYMEMNLELDATKKYSFAKYGALKFTEKVAIFTKDSL